MRQVFSNLKLINWNTNKPKALSISKNNNISIIENNTANVDLSDENIINEVLFLHENAIQKGINCKDIIQLIKQYIIIKNKSEKEIFNYLLNNKNKLQNNFLLAIFYHYGIGANKNE